MVNVINWLIIKIDKFQNVMFAVCPFAYFIIQLMSSICFSPKVALTMLLRFNKGYFKFYHLPVLPILLVNSIIFSILLINLKPGKSSTLVESHWSIVLVLVAGCWLLLSQLMSTLLIDAHRGGGERGEGGHLIYPLFFENFHIKMK
jgi:hypothetical protein